MKECREVLRLEGIIKMRCDWCGKVTHEEGLYHECKMEDHVKWIESEDFEMMIHREIFETGTSSWYGSEAIEEYKKHFKEDDDCKFCEALRK